jgi:hypothetical protein
MQKSKSFAVAGGMIRNGVFLPHPHGDLARAGAKKSLTSPAITHGMVRQTKGTQSAYHHGVAVQDEPMTVKTGCTGKSVPIHNGMRTKTPEARGADYGPDHGSKILGDAGNQSWRSDVASKHGVARLPIANKR